MLLDLNVGIISGDSVMEAGKLPEVDSPSSSTSVVSAEDARNNAAGSNFSSTNTSPLIFDVFKKESVTDVINTAPEFVTRQLFPFSGEGGVGDLGLRQGSSTATPKTEWLNLSCPNMGGPAELPKQQQVKKSRRGPRSRSSQYRGVTYYRRTGRWESHIWDCGKQVYLGGFDTSHSAARAYDRAAIKFRGVDADINFTLTDYEEDMKQTQNLSKEEFVHILRRQSTGFARGSSKFRGVTLHKCGRWEARMGQFLGKKAYDKAAIQCNGKEAVTNFEPSAYQGEIVMPASATNCHNLDLSLGVSLPWNEKTIESNALAPLAGESLNGLPVASKRSWSNMSVPTAYEGRAVLRSYNGAVPVYSSAASSGFASSGAHHQRNNNVVENLYHPKYTALGANLPHYFKYGT